MIGYLCTRSIAACSANRPYGPGAQVSPKRGYVEVRNVEIEHSINEGRRHGLPELTEFSCFAK